jgi:D-glycero-D-manno-heptose 1,7-bisphosphate phosphatase
MLLQAARDHHIDLGRSFMIGDKLADIEAGHAAGCRSLLVRTGYGARDEATVTGRFPETRAFKDLPAAVDYVLDVS